MTDLNPFSYLFGLSPTPDAERDRFLRGAADPRVARAVSGLSSGLTPSQPISMPASPNYVRATANAGRARQRAQEVNQQFGPFGGQAALSGNDEGQGPVPREASALLDTIAQFEGTADRPNGGYNTLVGGAQVSDLSRHPNTVGLTTIDGPSRAFGRYQFIPSTWRQAQTALNLSDMSPQSQDHAAWWLAQQAYRSTTGRELLSDINTGSRWPQIAQALGTQWASLPGNLGRNQRQHSIEDFVNALANHLNRAVSASPRNASEFIGTTAPGSRGISDFVRGRQTPADEPIATNRGRY